MISLRIGHSVKLALVGLPFLVSGICTLHAGPRPLYEQLLEANRNWVRVPPAKKEALSYPIELGETELLKTHLRLVEESLRSVDVSRLSPELRGARSKNLDALHDYWSRQSSPGNRMLPYRNPVFIDEQNRICAVGYLMQSDGKGKLASLLAATNDTVFIRDIENPAFKEWAAGSGLTLDELAWIQPMYGPANEQTWTPVGKGIQGQVYTIALGESGIYGAGRFDRADNTQLVRNIGYFNGRSWKAMGSGTNGPIYALAVQGPYVYAGGEFGKAGSTLANNVAVFDTKKNRGMKMGYGLTGPVRNLIFFKGNLYATAVDSVNSDRVGSLQRWDANQKSWEMVGEFNGEIRALAIYRDRLILGGDFTRIGDADRNHVAAYDGRAFSSLGPGVQNSFSAMTVFKDHLVVGSLTFTSEKGEYTKTCNAGLQTWDGSSWKSHIIATYSTNTAESECVVDGRITALAPVKNALAVGYRSSWTLKYPGSGNPLSFMTWQTLENGHIALAESGVMLTGLAEVNSIVVTRNQILLGGAFETDSTSYLTSAERSIGPGRNVLRYYHLESGLNRVQFGSLKGETMNLPRDLLK
ncbi:MAG: hypothetical protein JNM27_08290 [Leptospirales bacterium]|nr:hypothetical protein [Leptospirales bacterium]